MNRVDSKMASPPSYVRNSTLRDGTRILIRPIRPEDAPLEKEFIEGLSDESSFFRFFAVPRNPSPEMIEKLCNIDYVNQMALVAEATQGSRRFFVGVGRVVASTLNRAELAIVVADEYHEKGMATLLMSMLLEFAREKKFSSVYAMILPENTAMIGLAKKLGFKAAHHEDKVVIVELPLSQPGGGMNPHSS